MADVKPASLRSVSNAVPARTSDQVQVAPRPIGGTRPIENKSLPTFGLDSLDGSTALVSDFIQPTPSTMAWLSNPRLAATLQAASDALAPGGASEDPTDRYAASVLETHLVARKRLTKLTNSLLKT